MCFAGAQALYKTQSNHLNTNLLHSTWDYKKPILARLQFPVLGFQDCPKIEFIQFLAFLIVVVDLTSLHCSTSLDASSTASLGAVWQRDRQANRHTLATSNNSSHLDTHTHKHTYKDDILSFTSVPFMLNIDKTISHVNLQSKGERNSLLMLMFFWSAWELNRETESDAFLS